MVRIVALGVAVSAVKRQRLIVGVFGVIAVVSTVLFIWHFHARAKHQGLQPTANEPFMASIGWGEWVAIGAGLGIVIAAVLASRRTASGLTASTTP
jgi:ABC-type thiamin/hydroxymethylpyrimidine transport system permease subunit